MPILNRSNTETAMSNFQKNGVQAKGRTIGGKMHNW
jgi:hypothetical protein